MKVLRIVIKCEGAAVEEGGGAEVARILHKTAKWVAMGALDSGDNYALMDANGNKVGTLKLTEEE